MNGKRAKQIRKSIYGEMSLRQPRRYIINSHPGWGTVTHRSFKNIGLRAEYQKAKKAFKAKINQ